MTFLREREFSKCRTSGKGERASKKEQEVRDRDSTLLHLALGNYLPVRTSPSIKWRC